jgi:predicted transcriptional regulator
MDISKVLKISRTTLYKALKQLPKTELRKKQFSFQKLKSKIFKLLI